MSEVTINAIKFKRLLDYMETLGLDTEAIARSVNIVPARIHALPAVHALPAQQYARLYHVAVQAMQAFKHPVPWGAGVGTDCFEFMCRSVISARTLGEALSIAERYNTLMYSMVGYRMSLTDCDNPTDMKLNYEINIREAAELYAPPDWDSSGYHQTFACTSGLLVWCSFCGWLTGQPLELVEVHIAAPYLNRGYHERISQVFSCPIYFDAQENTLTFNREQLERRIVQNHDSLAEFLDSSAHHLLAVSSMQSSTSAAIKSLIATDLPSGLPSFTAVAETLHISESSLRRRLQKEETSYQKLKDEIRCEYAIDGLLNRGEKVADIAEFLGFAEPSSFVRSFKGWTGETPKSYKDRMRSLSQ